MTEIVRTRAHDIALALRQYVGGAEEDARLGAYQVARDAMASGVGLLEIVADHQEALAIVLAISWTPEDSQPWLRASAELLAEALAPFEMAHRGFQDTNESLLRVNADLKGQVAERERAEEAARVARDEAERANRAKSDFISRMSHELRTPLNAILGFGQILAADSLNEDQIDSVKQILKGGSHLLGLIDEVLDIARIDSGHLAISLEPVSLAEVVNEATALIGPLAAQRSIRVNDDLGPFGGRHVRADRQRLKQVLLNLASNAVKYNRQNGRVTLSCTDAAGGGLRIEVTDTGPGIRPEYLDRIFAPFDRLGAEGTGIEGTGIGLSLSKRLVELMGGRIGVHTAPQQGSTFWVELPESERPAEGPDHDDGQVLPDRSLGGPRRTLLYIEDNPSNLKLIERVLRDSTFDLLAAMQASLGLELAREHRPDAILLDFHLPGMTGEEVLRRLQAEPQTAGIPVIVLSADATPGQAERLLASGARPT